MPPKQTMSVKVGVKKGTLFLNESAVATVYDTRGSAWFKSNDVGAALGYTNASSSVTQKIPPEDKSAFQDISIHANSVKGDLHARNVFINQRGLIRYLRERDSSCDIIKIQNMSQSLNPSCSVDAQVPANTAVVRERVPVGRSFHNAIVIDVKGSSLMLNGTAVDTVYDYKSHAWFKCNDVAAALGFANASSSVSQHIHSNDKLSFSSISLHNDSPEVSAHSRSIFINQSGLVSFLLNLSPSCSVHKILNIGMSLNNNKPNPTPKTRNNSESSQFPTAKSNGQTGNHTGCRLLINNHPITIVVDVNEQGWFKVNDVADALGYANSSHLVSRHVSEADRNPFKNIDTHPNSPTINAHPLNVFINQKGLINIAPAANISTELPQNGTTNMSACEKIVLKAIYSYCKEFNRHSVTPLPISKTVSPPKNSELKASTSILTPTQPHHSASLSRNLSYAANAHPYVSSNYWSVGYIFIVVDTDVADNPLKVIQSSEPRSSNKNILWQQQVHSAPKLLKLIEYFLSNWISDDQVYIMPSKKLLTAVSTICSNFEKTLHAVYELTSKMKHPSTHSSTHLQPIPEDQIKSLAQSPKYSGEWIYIASSIPYADVNAFKVGSTGRLAKRLAPYQTGRLKGDEYYYFAVFPVHNCKSVDNNFIQFFLRPWSQINHKGQPTEMYCDLDFKTLKTLVSEIINFHENSLAYS